MSYSFIDGTLAVPVLIPEQISLPSACVSDSQVAAGAAIQQTKTEKKSMPVYAQAGGSSAVSERRVAYVVSGATGTVLSIKAGVVVAGTTGNTTTIDVQKNGTTILTAPVAVSTTTAYTLVAAGIASSTLAAGDVLEVVVAAAAGAGAVPKGVFVVFALREDAF
jgi:hypothetical protein